jgi:hypothetical protein
MGDLGCEDWLEWKRGNLQKDVGLSIVGVGTIDAFNVLRGFSRKQCWICSR